MSDKGEANAPYLRTKGGLVCIARNCLPRTSQGETLIFNSIILSRSLIVSLRIGDTVMAKGANVLSDIFEGNRVAILIKVKDFALGWEF